MLLNGVQGFSFSIGLLDGVNRAGKGLLWAVSSTAEVGFFFFCGRVGGRALHQGGIP